MRNALGRVLTAAVLVGSFGAPLPAWAENISGLNDRSPEPVPVLVKMGLESPLGPTFSAPSSLQTVSAKAPEKVEGVQPQVLDILSIEPQSSPKAEPLVAEEKAEAPAEETEVTAKEDSQAAETPVAEAKPVKETPAAEKAQPLSEAPATEKVLPVSEAPAPEEAKPASEAPTVEEVKPANEGPAAETSEAQPAEGAQSVEEAPAQSESAEGSQVSAEESENAATPATENAQPASEAPTPEEAQPAEGAQSVEEAPAQGETPAQVQASPEGKVEGAQGETEAPAESAAAPISPVFSGTVEAVTPESLRIAGLGRDGEPVSLDFIVDDHSQLAEGIKIGDSLTVYYEVAQSGGYRVTSARYLSGEAPANVFPSDIASDLIEKKEETGTETQPEADVPKVVSIEVEGNQTVPSDEILQIISTRIGDPLLEPRIRRDMQAIYDSGYYTDVRLDTRYTADGVRIIFRVLENPVVNEIVLTGNSVADTQKLRSLMQLETGKVLNTRTLQNDLQAINKYYNEDLGYTISPSHVTKLDFSNGVLTLTLVDGITVTAVKVEGVTVFPQERIASMITLKPGDLFNRNTLRDDTEKISALYDQKQYILDTIKPSVDVETGVVTVTVVEAVLQEIKLVGNQRTKDDTILRNIRTKPGEVMRRDRIQKDLERLSNLGLFKKVEPEVEPGSAPGQAILVLNIEEQKTGLATVGVGYAGGGSGAVRPGITGAVSYSERNLFGEGKQISVNLQRGSQIGSYGISYYDPAINDAQDSIGVSVYYNSVDELEQQVTGADYGTYAYYDQEVYGATVTYGHPFSDDLRGFVTLRHETVNLTMSGKSLYVPVGLGKGDLNAIGISTLYDTRDDVFSPHKGSYANLAFTYAGLGGDYDYTKFVFEGRHYVPITKRSTLALRGMYGTVGNGAPASEYFYAGGTDTLRGYQDNSMFGNKVVLLNAEYRFPIGNIKMLSGAVFVDAGNAWISGYNDNRLYTDAGVGLRIVFPNLGLGVIRIDYAFGQDGSRSSIGIGQSF